MVEMKVYLSQGLNERFRRLAMSVYGYGRGSLSRAAEEAFSKWCTEREMQSSPESEANRLSLEREDVENNRSGINPDERPPTGTESITTEEEHYPEQGSST
ncbi:MAG TPA: hypothetical protein VE955_01505 [Candidatus Dormibacteraeota bacterium]|nr:hypothetical protein [Candidatus Dormibacteraeota bacterium]